MKFSSILKDLRTDKRLTQAQLAEIIGITQDSISLWEKGKRIPDTQYILQLADFFEVTTDYLLGRSDDLGNVTVQSAAPDLSKNEQELLAAFNRLNDEYQTLAVTTLKNWAEIPAQKATTKHA